MEKQTPYLTQFCNLSFEWQSTGINFDDATESQQERFKELRAQAIEQSGLTCNELSLICNCRLYPIFERVNRLRQEIKIILNYLVVIASIIWRLVQSLSRLKRPNASSVSKSPALI